MESEGFMRIGDLVRITRASIGVPRGSIGLVIECTTYGNNIPHLKDLCGQESCTWGIKLNGFKHPRRYLEMDLEIINASR